MVTPEQRFPDYKRHIDHVVATHGQWVGLCDEEGWPIADITPVVALSAPEIRGDTASVEATVAVEPSSPLVAELIGDGLSAPLEDGQLTLAGEKARLLVVQRPDRRVAYTVTHTVAAGVSGPSQLTIHGVDLIEGLTMWPCPSIPAEWGRAKFSEWDTDASGQKYATSRELARVEFGTAVDGYTVRGPAVTVVRTLIQDSLDAVNDLMGWRERPHMVVHWPDEVDESDELLIRTSDDTVWETIAAPAHAAGLTIHVDLWWPGDGDFRFRAFRDPDIFVEASADFPIQLVTVEVTK